MSITKRLRADFSPIAITLIPVAIVLNIVIGQVTSMLSLPIFLDSIGTILIALLAGPWVAGLAGLLTNIIWGVISAPTAIAFAPVAMVIGIVAGLLASMGMFRSWWRTVISGALIAVALSFVAVPIRTYLFGGVTGSGADLITAYLVAVGRSLFGSVLVTVIASNLVDKIVTALLAWVIVKGLGNRFVARFPRAAAVTGSE